MLKQPAMGDTPAPASKRHDSVGSSDKPASAESPIRERDSATLAVAERAIASASSTPPTDDIDSEWPDEQPAQVAAQAEPEPESPSVSKTSALAPPLDDVDSAWGAEGESPAAPAALVSPTFPSDPGLPRDLRTQSGVPSSRRVAAAEPPPSRREIDTVPAAPQASRPPGSLGANSSARLQAAAEAAVAEAAAASARAPIVSRSEAPPSGATRDGRHTVDPHVRPSLRSEAPAPSRAPLVAALVAAAGLALWLLRPATAPHESADAANPQPPAAEPARPAEPPPAPVAAAPAPVVEAPAAEVAAKPAEAEKPVEAAAKPTETAPEAAAKPTESPVAQPAPAEGAPSEATPGTTRVVISVKPPNARLFYRGKEVGKPPVAVEVETGKRKSFEVALPGFMTRKVVIDGSKTEVTVGLRPDPAATPAQ